MKPHVPLVGVLLYITPRRIKMTPLILFILSMPGVHSDSHRLLYYCSAVSVPGRGLLEFSIIGSVDDQQIILYRSDVGQDRPVAPWMNKEGPEYWDRETLVSKRMELVFKEMMKITMNRFNHTGVKPEVKVWSRQKSGEMTRLQCLVYGFHPRAVDVKWMKNGVDHVSSDEMSPILPHPDGTYQIRVSVEVQIKKGDTYSCHVEHNSLEKVLIVKWEPDNGFQIGVFVGAIIGCVGLIALFIFVKKCIEKKKSGRGSNANPNSSTNLSEACDGEL